MSQAYRKKQVVQPIFTDEELLLRSLSSSRCNKCNSTGKKRTWLYYGTKYAEVCKCVPTSLIYSDCSPVVVKI